jgi:hypothetical protein
VEPVAARRRVLLLHDGELGDIRGILARLGADCVERWGPAADEDLRTAFDLVVGTPRQLLRLEAALLTGPAVCIGVLERDSGTLRALLRRSGVRFVVRRPVHPAALRLLLLHQLHRGPEQRRTGRVSVGAPVRIRSGLRGSPAILADLSARGCHLLARHPAPRGTELGVTLPARVADGRALHLRGEVVRSRPAPEAGRGLRSIAVALAPLAPEASARLEKLLALYAEGPAVLPGGPEPPRDATLAPSPARGERRAGPRRALVRARRPAEPARPVLVGRDLSRGGMRVDPDPILFPGGDLLLALYGGEDGEALVLPARVVRDQGSAGVLLRFGRLTETEQRRIDAIVSPPGVEAVEVALEETPAAVVCEVVACGLRLGPEASVPAGGVQGRGRAVDGS